MERKLQKKEENKNVCSLMKCRGKLGHLFIIISFSFNITSKTFMGMEFVSVVKRKRKKTINSSVCRPSEQPERISFGPNTFLQSILLNRHFLSATPFRRHLIDALRRRTDNKIWVDTQMDGRKSATNNVFFFRNVLKITTTETNWKDSEHNFLKVKISYVISLIYSHTFISTPFLRRTGNDKWLKKWENSSYMGPS